MFLLKGTYDICSLLFLIVPYFIQQGEKTLFAQVLSFKNRSYRVQRSRLVSDKRQVFLLLNSTDDHENLRRHPQCVAAISCGDGRRQLVERVTHQFVRGHGNVVHQRNLTSSDGVLLERLHKPCLFGKSHRSPVKVLLVFQHRRSDVKIATTGIGDVNCDRVTSGNLVDYAYLTLRQLLGFQVNGNPHQSLLVNYQFSGSFTLSLK